MNKLEMDNCKESKGKQLGANQDLDATRFSAEPEEDLEEERLSSSGEQVVELCLEPGVRLDIAVAEALGKSRSFIQNLIADNRVAVNGVNFKANYRLRANDAVTVVIPPPKPLAVEPEDIPLEIIYEDEDLLVVNKPQGMVVHPAPGAWTGTMVNALLYHCRDLSGINGVLRPGIVHRIDKDTSGVLVVAKNDDAHRGLAEQIKAHSMKRQYLMLVHGHVLESSGTVDAPIGRDQSERKRMAVTFQNSKSAVTHYTVLERFKDFTYLQAQLETGRTHQIRVHMAYIKHVVLGDSLYGPKHNSFDLEGQALHAARLGFHHPRTGAWLEFEAAIPDNFKQVLEQLRSGSFEGF